MGLGSRHVRQSAARLSGWLVNPGAPPTSSRMRKTSFVYYGIVGIDFNFAEWDLDKKFEELDLTITSKQSVRSRVGATWTLTEAFAWLTLLSMRSRVVKDDKFLKSSSRRAE